MTYKFNFVGLHKKDVTNRKNIATNRDLQKTSADQQRPTKNKHSIIYIYY